MNESGRLPSDLDAIAGSATSSGDGSSPGSPYYPADCGAGDAGMRAVSVGRPPEAAILERNLEAIARRSPLVAQAIAGATARSDVVEVETRARQDGRPVLSARLAGSGPGPGRQIDSLKDPIRAGERLASTFDAREKGAAVVVGFGMGHHLRPLADRLGRQGVVVCYEPDLGLLRWVLERVDHSDWMTRTNFALLLSDEDVGAMSRALAGVEPLVALGVQVISHPASQGRVSGERAFRANIQQAVHTAATHLRTTLLQIEPTIRNILQNLDHYALTPGIDELRDALAGRPAIIVSAGPSLSRNMQLLADPDVRERFVIIAAQTVLRPLLDAGITPHFVTALDFHEVSSRFYEGLSREQLTDVTLVFEGKANPAIAESFPGPKRTPHDKFASAVLGDLVPAGVDGGKPKGEIKPGSTVAHLAYYLARHMGCDPVVMIGQDLGFTDGQYYADGAAIHRTWSGELNQFRSLEMMEWERIVRGRTYIKSVRDSLGRPVFTDQQMLAYLLQFERDFDEDIRSGRRVIDATEGGVAKRGAETMSLADALMLFRPSETLAVPETSLKHDRGRLGPVRERVAEVRRDVREVEQFSREAKQKLESLLEAIDNNQADEHEVNRIIGQVHDIRDRVMKLDPAFNLVNMLNQTGALNRLRADRLIELEELEPKVRQRRQVERDIRNVQWLADAAASLAEMIADAEGALRGEGKRTRDRVIDERVIDEGALRSGASGRSVAAIISVDTERGGLGTRRDLEQPVLGGKNALRLMIERLGRCERLSRAILVCEDVERARRLAGESVAGLTLEFCKADSPVWSERRASIARARAFSPACWRGGLGGLTVFDEALEPTVAAPIMTDREIDACVVVGADWALVDPALVDQAIERHLDHPDLHKLVFTQAPPGIGAAVVERSVMQGLTERALAGDHFATIGGLLSYMPNHPRPDPLGRDLCVPTPRGVRDLGLRCIPDTSRSIDLMRERLSPLAREIGDGSAGAGRIAEALSQHGSSWIEPGVMPQQITLELTTRRAQGLDGGLRGVWQAGIERKDMPLSVARSVIDEAGLAREDIVLNLAGRGDPMQHESWREVIKLAKESGLLGVHVRTDLVCDRAEVDALLASPVDVISVDLLGARAETYRRLTGADKLELVRRNIERLLEARSRDRGMPSVWVAPRMTRCDAVYEEVDAFYDECLRLAGACVIDPMPRAREGERIAPLTVPTAARRRALATELTIRCDGTADGGIDVRETGLARLWGRVAEARLAAEGPSAVVAEAKPVGAPIGAA